MTKRILTKQYPNLFVIGIISNKKPIKVAWLLNNCLNFDLIESSPNEPSLSELTIFSQNFEKNKFVVIENIKTNTDIFNQLNKFDYLIITDLEEQEVKSIIEKTKKIKEFEYVLLLPIENLNKKNLQSIYLAFEK